MAIFITGFHRAGTHSYAENIARENKTSFIEEGKIRWDDLSLAKEFVDKDKEVIIHCPGLAHEVETLATLGKVYWCTREPLSIVTSMKNAGINEQAWHITNNFKRKYPEDTIWETLIYNGKEDVWYGFVRYYNLVIKIKEHFYQKYFKEITEEVKLEEQPYYNWEECLSCKHPLSEPLRESLHIRQA